MTLIFKDPSFKVFLTFAKGFLSAKMTSNFLLDASRNQVQLQSYQTSIYKISQKFLGNALKGIYLENEHHLETLLPSLFQGRPFLLNKPLLAFKWPSFLLYWRMYL